MEHGGGIVAEASINRVAPVLSSSDPAPQHTKIDQLRKKLLL